MELILENPYRLIGILVGATAREQERQIKRLKQFIEVEQEPKDDFSFPSLGKLNRTLSSVSEAASKLNLDSDKINAALFWFYNGNVITDEVAFEAIKDGNTDKAIEIWRKLVYGADDKSYNVVEKKNASAFNNLSTLYLHEYGIDEDTLQLKIRFLESDFFSELKSKSTDETYKISKKEIQLLFLNGLGHLDGFETSEFIDAISEIEFTAKDDFLKGFVQKPIEQLERLLIECKSHRKSKKEDVIVAGTNLYNAAKPVLNQLKGILGISNIKYSSISDKISDEVLQCGIQLFNDYKDHETYDPGEPTKKLFSKAKSLAIGSIAKQRYQENEENLKDWIDNKPEREKQKLIGDDLQFITSKLETFQTLDDTINNAKLFINSCKPKLANIRAALGEYDDFYVTISSAIVSNAQGMLVTAVNDAQTNFTNTRNIHELTNSINDAYNLTQILSSFHMNSNLRKQFQNNQEILTKLKNQLYNATTSPMERVGRSIGEKTAKATSGGGCYIATMAYGDYDHPQVMILRQFRDEVLDNTAFGRWFIKTYYHHSPKLVEKLKNKKKLNAIFRKILNQFIKLIK